MDFVHLFASCCSMRPTVSILGSSMQARRHEISKIYIIYPLKLIPIMNGHLANGISIAFDTPQPNAKSAPFYHAKSFVFESMVDIGAAALPRLRTSSLRCNFFYNISFRILLHPECRPSLPDAHCTPQSRPAAA